VIAMLLPYTSENYPVKVRGRDLRELERRA
jgi:hypothetical protein